MLEKFTDCARLVFCCAVEEAQRMNHDYIGTEHLLLGIAREGSGIAAQYLKNQGYSLTSLRAEVEKFVGYGPDMVTRGELSQNPTTKQVTEYAISHANKRNDGYVDSMDILYGLLKVKDGIALQVLNNLGFKKEGLEGILGSEKTNSQEEPKEKESSYLLAPKKGYWMVPKAAMDLYDYLKTFGYRMKGDKNDDSIYVCRGDNTLAMLEKNPKDLLEDKHLRFNPILSYQQRTISQVLELRELLELNSVPYTESPKDARKKFASELYKTASENISIAQRLEGKVEMQGEDETIKNIIEELEETKPNLPDKETPYPTGVPDVFE